MYQQSYGIAFNQNLQNSQIYRYITTPKKNFKIVKNHFSPKTRKQQSL
ncbi:hypothetical protein T05_1345 [Trichinella murrelli]|uniref:Uncharacterized protein n=1 Tax=Trichinella murrelli TaxID=144512 RepID=A0A0V0SWC4_9BILA|nr:hypothetical protein T05_1345 [Trichinella murrelli]